MYMLLNTAIRAIFWAIIYVCNPGAIYSHCGKSNFILTFLLEGCLEYQIYQVQYLQSNKAGFGGYKIIKFSTSYGRPIYRETENIQEGYRDRLSKTGLDFENCTQQLFTLTMCLSACLWAQIARTLFNYTITARTLLPKYNDYQFQRLIFQFPALGKKLSYRNHVHHNPGRKYASRCWDKRKCLHVLWDKTFPEVRTNRVESMKTLSAARVFRRWMSKLLFYRNVI